jgi:hypothetical protein
MCSLNLQSVMIRAVVGIRTKIDPVAVRNTRIHDLFFYLLFV